MAVPNDVADLVGLVTSIAVGAAILLLRMLLNELRAMRDEEEARHEDADPDSEARSMGTPVRKRRSR